jgi:hypothetical protein
MIRQFFQSRYIVLLNAFSVLISSILRSFSHSLPPPVHFCVTACTNIFVILPGLSHTLHVLQLLKCFCVSFKLISVSMPPPLLGSVTMYRNVLFFSAQFTQQIPISACQYYNLHDMHALLCAANLSQHVPCTPVLYMY